MTTLRPYPDYKPSGIDWLGEIPYHWEAAPLRRTANVQASNVDKHIVDGELAVCLCNYTDVYYNRRITSEIGFSKGTVTSEELQRFKLCSGDVLITKDSESWDDIAVAAVVAEDFHDVVCGYHLSQIRPENELEGRFLGYWIESHEGSIHFKVSANGVTRYGLSANAIKSVGVPLPPLDEQRAIADFLDAADERITRFIAARRRMIALLEEQKQAIINQAMTRGLDPDVPLKPSGIDWLGDIPAHWDVLRTKTLYREVDERSEYGDEVQLSVSHLTGVTPRSEKNVTMLQAETYEGHKLCRPGDLVVNTMWAWMGALGVVRQSGIVSPSYAVYRLRRFDTANSQYLHTLLRTRPYVDEYNRRSTGIHSSRLRLYPDQFLNILIPVPPRPEQELIVAAIESLDRQTFQTIERYQREVELIQEYRTRLISDVVTGKLDVRSMELPLSVVSSTKENQSSPNEVLP